MTGKSVYGLKSVISKRIKGTGVQKIECVTLTRDIYDWLAGIGFDVRMISEEDMWPLPMKLKRDLWGLEEAELVSIDEELTKRARTIGRKKYNEIYDRLYAWENWYSTYGPTCESDFWTYKPKMPTPISDEQEDLLAEAD